MTMMCVSASQFRLICDWIERAHNFLGSRTDVTGTSWYLKIESAEVKAAERWMDDTGDYVHQVHRSIFYQWQKQFGYTISI